MCQTGQTIEETLSQVPKPDLVLPAMQREFVRRLERICRLFDSLMQVFRPERLLDSKVTPENSDKFKFYGFVLEYHERDSRHCLPLLPMPSTALTAPLDGQQRLAALNVGRCGSVMRKLPRGRWNNPEAFPKRHPYLDSVWNVRKDNDEGSGYRFSFRRENEPSQRTNPTDYESECRFQVGEMLSMASGPAMFLWLNKRLDRWHTYYAYESLDWLHGAVQKNQLVAEHFRSVSAQTDLTRRVLARIGG